MTKRLRTAQGRDSARRGAAAGPQHAAAAGQAAGRPVHASHLQAPSWTLSLLLIEMLFSSLTQDVELNLSRSQTNLSALLRADAMSLPHQDESSETRGKSTEPTTACSLRQDTAAPMHLRTRSGECCRALDLEARSDADPEQLLASFSGRPPMSQDQAVNDLEPPAFGV